MEQTGIRFFVEHNKMQNCLVYIVVKNVLDPRIFGLDLSDILNTFGDKDLRSIISYVLNMIDVTEYHFEHTNSVPDIESIMYDIEQMKNKDITITVNDSIHKKQFVASPKMFNIEVRKQYS